MSVFHYVLEYKSPKSPELLKRFSQKSALYVFPAREDDQDRSQPCKNWVVCLSVRGHNSRKSRELLKRFSQNFVLHTFQAREDDLDRFQLCKQLGCLSICP